MAESPKKKKKKHNPLLDWLLYAALRVLVTFLCMFPIETNLNTACVLGRLLWKYYHRGRQRALDNLRASFPDKDQAWLEAVGRRSFEQVVMLTVDILFTPRLVKTYNWRNYAQFKNIERPKQMMLDGQGLLLITAHYGNFEIMGYVMAAFGLNIYSVARPLDNTYINEYLLGVRERTGQKIIDKKGASDLMEKVASSGFSLGFIADQDAGKKGIFVDFFGRKASTYKSIGLLAVMYNMPIVIGCTRRVGTVSSSSASACGSLCPMSGRTRMIRSCGFHRNTHRPLKMASAKTPRSTGGSTAAGRHGPKKSERRRQSHRHRGYSKLLSVIVCTGVNN